MYKNDGELYKKKHLDYIDTAKGIGMLCIVFGHIMTNGMLWQWCFAFHVPFFFFISGITYRYKPDKIKFILNKIKRLLVPYWICSLISILIFYFFSHNFNAGYDSRILPNLLGMLYANSNSGYMEWNKPLWFLPCLFAASIIMDNFETILVLLKKQEHDLFRVIFIVLFLTIGIMWNVYLKRIILPFQIESAIYLVGFMEMGYLVGRNKKISVSMEERGIKTTLFKYIFVLIGIAAGVCISTYNGVCEIRGHRFGSVPVLFLLSSLTMTFAFFIFSGIVQKNKILQIIGKKSLSILLLHKFIVIVIQRLPFFREHLKKGDSVLGISLGLVSSVAVIFLCILLDIAGRKCASALKLRKNLVFKAAKQDKTDQ